MEEQMTRHPISVEENKKPLKPQADDQSHVPAKHIEETARLASSVETAKDPLVRSDAPKTRPIVIRTRDEVAK
jgi:hypothetical protein